MWFADSRVRKCCRLLRQSADSTRPRQGETGALLSGPDRQADGQVFAGSTLKISLSTLKEQTKVMRGAIGKCPKWKEPLATQNSLREGEMGKPRDRELRARSNKGAKGAERSGRGVSEETGRGRQGEASGRPIPWPFIGSSSWSIPKPLYPHLPSLSP